MVDLIPYVNRLLKSTGAQVELSYSNLRARLPLIILTEISNTEKASPDGTAFLSDITIQIDVYEHTEQRAHELSATVSGIMTGAGFRRIASQFTTEDGMKRKMMRFSTTVDETTNRLYRGAS